MALKKVTNKLFREASRKRFGSLAGSPNAVRRVSRFVSEKLWEDDKAAAMEMGRVLRKAYWKKLRYNFGFDVNIRLLLLRGRQSEIRFRLRQKAAAENKSIVNGETR